MKRISEKNWDRFQGPTKWTRRELPVFVWEAVKGLSGEDVVKAVQGYVELQAKHDAMAAAVREIKKEIAEQYNASVREGWSQIIQRIRTIVEGVQ